MENRTSALPAPSLRERLLVLAALEGHIRDPQEQIAGQPLLMGDAPLPKTMDEFDRRFQEIGELEGKLRMAASCARYAAELAAGLPNTARRKLTDAQRHVVERSEGDLAATVEQSEKNVRELGLETHLLRLRYGVQALRSERLTKEKFIAAATTRVDGRTLKEALAPPASPVKRGAAKGQKAKPPAAPDDGAPAAPVAPLFQRATLSGGELGDEIDRLVREAEDLAGPLGEKAERFFAGLDAWLRGRYGWGPDVWGLAKAEAALKNESLLQEVQMPEELPKDVGNPRTTATHPDRRHHYIWAWEDRRLAVSAAISDPKTTFGVHKLDAPGRRGGVLYGGNHLLTRDFHQTVSVPPQDPRLVYRIVGFLEYGQAVQALDQFVAEASAAEFEIGEEIVRSQEPFRFQTNLSRTLERGAGALSERSENPRDDFQRQGLEWMLGLARVEVGAMLAGFTSHPDPFLSMAPRTTRQTRVQGGPFGNAAYAELLLDGLRTQYWAVIVQDVIAGYFKTGVPESHLLTGWRRANVGRQFVRAVLNCSEAGNLSAEQRKELEVWDQTFLKLQRMMVYCMTFKVGQTRATRSRYTYHIYAPIPSASQELATRTQQAVTVQRDQTPDAIRRLLQTVDPTLAGCACH